MFWLILCLSLANAASECNVRMIEGHHHFTTIRDSKFSSTCYMDIDAWPIFIELERYAGRTIDKSAHMNITLSGPTPLSLTIGYNEIHWNGFQMGIPTMTMLEHSMWLAFFKKGDEIIVQFAPPESHYMGSIGHWPDVEVVGLEISAYTETGMEQVVRQILSDWPTEADESQVLKKTIRELERRIRVLEDDITTIDEKNKRQDNLHKKHLKDKYDQQRRVNEIHEDLSSAIPHEKVAQLEFTFRAYAWVFAVAVVIGVYVSWRMYKRQQKLHRWTL